MERSANEIIKQVERIIALLYNATYPGDGMWRFKTACEMIVRGAAAEAEREDSDMSSCDWLAGAMKILMMESRTAYLSWCYFSPRNQTEIARAFLPAAQAMLDWVNTIRKREAEEYESDFESIGFGYGTPESVILHKFDYSDEELDEKMLKSLLFTEDIDCELIYNKLFFQQMYHTLQADVENIDYSEPTHKDDIEECNVVIRELYKDRAKQERRENDGTRVLPKNSFHEIFEDLSASNEEFRERERKELEEISHKLDAFAESTGFYERCGFPRSSTKESLNDSDKQVKSKDISLKENVSDDDRQCRFETLGRFKVYRSESRLTVEDIQNKKRYEIGRSDSNAAKAVLTLLRDYAAGNKQVHDSSRKWIGAFQPGRGGATEFYSDQVFKLPKWSVEKGRYLKGQHCGKLRLWTDEEMALSAAKRLEGHKAEFPRGYPWDK